MFHPIQEPLGNAGQTGLGSGKRAGQDGARLVLPLRLSPPQHPQFEVAGEAGCEVVRGKRVVQLN
ncbi:MAG TPA: hypothetical protein VF243_01370 [Nitrosospira sp.]